MIFVSDEALLSSEVLSPRHCSLPPDVKAMGL